MQQAIDHYYAALKQYDGLGVAHETALRSAMQNLLAEAGKEAGWTLVPEQTVTGGKRPDGTFRDAFNLARGYWEAKDTKDDLETEIRKKIALGYPLGNTLFEDTRRAVLFQGRDNRLDFDLSKPQQLRDLLKLFTTYAAPDIADFYKAVEEFAARLAELAEGLKGRIEQERTGNSAFVTAFASFHDLCRSALNPTLSADAIEEMLVQHLLTERLFRTIFENPDFTRRNVIAAEIEKVIDALTRRAFNRQEFLRSLDRYYVAIEEKGRGITDWQEKQGFLNRVYERFFQGYSTKQADAYGIVYTPQEIVSFMLASVEHLLKTEFMSSLSALGVKILDSCTGTGNFIVNLLRHHISRRDMRAKYENELFANEIMLLPYYIASLNIEHEFYAQTGEYLPFEGLCFADTLDMAEGPQLSMFGEENTERLQRERDAPITVILGNPPYNAHQVSENDNNKNRRYGIVDKRVSETYAKASRASNKNALSDAYVKFFRWASDRLQGRDGIVAFVSNNAFLDQIAFDGMRKCLLDEFTTIYHLDCGGNVRKNPKLSGTTHNVFGIQVGVGITLLVRRQSEERARLLYHAQETMARASARLAEIKAWNNVTGVPWRELTPDDKQNWLTEGLRAEFGSFLPLGSKEAKSGKGEEVAIFRIYGRGVATCRDDTAYGFSRAGLNKQVIQFLEDYNSEVDRWIRVGSPKDIDGFVDYGKVKWSEGLKVNLVRGTMAKVEEGKIRSALYRPFCTRWLYFDALLNERRYQFPSIFPTAQSERDNIAICITDIGSEKPFMALATRHISDLHIVGAGASAQCFPFFTYDADKTNQRENITDETLAQFRAANGPPVSKRDIFHYVYALLHDPVYRERYAENLKRELPRIPLTPPKAGEGAAPTFSHYVSIGAKLMRLHLGYEEANEYPLQWLEDRDMRFSWRVEKMRLSKDRTQVVVNESLTLGGIPPEAFEYRLGNRSALEWVIDQYQVTTDKRSGIVSDPNRPDDPEYIVRLVGRVVTVSVETVRLVKELRGKALTP